MRERHAPGGRLLGVQELRVQPVQGKAMMIRNLILALFSAFAIHEGAHYLAARCFGKRLKFRFSWGRLWKIPIPRWVWTMPYFAEPWKRRVVALAGFGAEFLAVAVFYALTTSFWGWYAGVVLAHIGMYRIYAGEDSDFRWV